MPLWLRRLWTCRHSRLRRTTRGDIQAQAPGPAVSKRVHIASHSNGRWLPPLLLWLAPTSRALLDNGCDVISSVHLDRRRAWTGIPLQFYLHRATTTYRRRLKPAAATLPPPLPATSLLFMHTPHTLHTHPPHTTLFPQPHTHTCHLHTPFDTFPLQPHCLPTFPSLPHTADLGQNPSPFPHTAFHTSLPHHTTCLRV